MFFNSLAKVIVTISLANRKLRQCDNIMTASRMCGQGSREKGSRFLVIALLKTFPDTHERSMNDLASRSSSCHHESSEVNVLLADLSSSNATAHCCEFQPSRSVYSRSCWSNLGSHNSTKVEI